MENIYSNYPQKYIETGGVLANHKILHEIYDQNNLQLKVRINQRNWESGLEPKYVIDKRATIFISEIGRLAIKFKISLLKRFENDLN